MASPPKKQRLDILLVERGLAADIRKAQALILARQVFSGSVCLDKAGMQVKPDIALDIKSRKSHDYVSRGGLKLEHGLKHFAVDAKGKTALDIGSSTGGFTDVLLRGGAKKVYAVDVGYGELDYRLREDSRVVALERTNARHLTPELVPEKADIIVCDASFIRLENVLPVPLTFAAPGTILIALIKPQFEVTKDKVGKGGIVTDSALHTQVCETVQHWLGTLPGWRVLGITESPITGMEGNKEFLIGAVYDPV